MKEAMAEISGFENIGSPERFDDDPPRWSASQEGGDDTSAWSASQ